MSNELFQIIIICWLCYFIVKLLAKVLKLLDNKNRLRDP